MGELTRAPHVRSVAAAVPAAQPAPVPAAQPARASRLRMHGGGGGGSHGRRAFLHSAFAAAAAAAAAAGAATAIDGGGGGGDAEAAVTDSFAKKLYPKEGFNVEDKSTKPAVSDEAIKQVKQQLDAVRAYRRSVDDIKRQFSADPSSSNVVDEVRKAFPTSRLRDDLNKVADSNPQFDFEVQKSTDRIVRNILQDLTELENAARLKSGAPRTPKKADAVSKWLDSVAIDFDRLLSYYTKQEGER